MIVFDRAGNFLRSWGGGTFPHAHDLFNDADDIPDCTDDGGHFVRKCTTESKVLLEIDVPGKPAPYMSRQPFHRCTHTVMLPTGDIYAGKVSYAECAPVPGLNGAVAHAFFTRARKADVNRADRRKRRGGRGARSLLRRATNPAVPAALTGGAGVPIIPCMEQCSLY